MTADEVRISDWSSDVCSSELVVRDEQAVLPELTLTVTETSIDKSSFTLDVLPDGEKKVTTLGQVAYRRPLHKTAQAGPAAGVGWLATDGRVATLNSTETGRVGKGWVCSGRLRVVQEK